MSRGSGGRSSSWTTTTKSTSKSSAFAATGGWTTILRWPNCFVTPAFRRARNPNRPKLPMTPSRESESVLIFDFGSQFAQLIARRVRELNVFCQIVRHDLSAERVAALKPAGIILSGGPASVYAPGAPRCDPKVFDLGIPILGICYGMQLAYHQLGGEVIPSTSR